MGIKEIASKKGTLYFIPATAINFLEGFNRRTVRENKEELKASIRAAGKVLTPITVFTGDDGKTYVQSGHGRVECAKELIAEGFHIEAVPCITTTKPKTDDEMATCIARQVVDNAGEPFTPVDLAKVFGDLRDDYGWSNSKISEFTGKSESLVGQYLRVIDSPDVLSRVEAGEISVSLAAGVIQSHGESATEVLTKAPKNAKGRITRKSLEAPKEGPKAPKDTPAKVLKTLLEDYDWVDGDAEYVTISFPRDLWERISQL